MKSVKLAIKKHTTGEQYSSKDGMAYSTKKTSLAKCLFDHKMLGVLEGVGLCTVSNHYGRAVVTPLDNGQSYIITIAECFDYIIDGGVFITENIGAI